MEEEDNIIVKWAQEGVETSYRLLNKYTIDFKTHVTNQYKRWDPIGITKVCTLINTICFKPDDGRIRPKHVAS